MEGKEKKSSFEGIGCFVKWKERTWLKFLWTHWGICNCTSIITLYQLFCLNRRNFPCSVQYYDFLLDPCAGIVELRWGRFHNYDITQNLRHWAGISLEPLCFRLPLTDSSNSQRPQFNDFTTERPKMFNSTHRFHILSPSPMATEFTINHRSPKNLHAAADHVLLFDGSPPSVHHDHHSLSQRPEVSP